MTDRQADDGYRGTASLRIGEERLDVQVELRGFFEPIDGRYRWYGRIVKDERLHLLLGGGAGQGELDTGQGSGPRACELSDPDLWGRYRIAGRSTPPFPVATRV